MPIFHILYIFLTFNAARQPALAALLAAQVASPIPQMYSNCTETRKHTHTNTDSDVYPIVGFVKTQL